MESEKDGFPITAVREMRLLQALKQDNVICLLEMMVEKSESSSGTFIFSFFLILYRRLLHGF